MTDVKKQGLKQMKRIMGLARNTDATKTLFMAWADEHLNNLTLSILNLELVIEGYGHLVRLYSDWSRAERTPEDAEAHITEMVSKVSNDVRPIFQQLQGVKKERAEYLANEVWKEMGRLPREVEHESVLKPETMQLFSLDSSLKDSHRLPLLSRFNIKHH